jgi:DNA-binding MarR family transcriptional regulator
MRDHGGGNAVSPGVDDPVSALAALLAPGGRLARQCGFCYELRLHRARGYGALKAILEILAEEEGLTLTEISHRLQRTPGSTKDYLSWLEDVDLVTSRQKRYSYTDPLLRVWVRLHCRASAPTEDDLAREVHRYALPRLPQQLEPALAMATAGGGPSEEDRKAWGIIEID